MLNDTFHSIEIGPKWKAFLRRSERKYRIRFPDGVQKLGIGARLKKFAKRRAA